MAIEDHKVLRAGTRWQDLRLYKKSDTLYQFTVVFCHRFLPPYGDRTVDQMVQAARSGKQNIVEGSEDGKTSTEMELKLINVARASLSELREDYKDFLVAHNYRRWDSSSPRYAQMQGFTRSHNDWPDYEALSQTWTEEEMANVGLTLCYQMDAMLNRYLKRLETEFVTEGGIKERMHKARTGYRQEQDQLMATLKAENSALQAEINTLQAGTNALQAENDALRQQLSKLQSDFQELRARALKAYNEQKAQIEQLKGER